MEVLDAYALVPPERDRPATQDIAKRRRRAHRFRVFTERPARPIRARSTDSVMGEFTALRRRKSTVEMDFTTDTGRSAPHP